MNRIAPISWDLPPPAFPRVTLRPEPPGPSCRFPPDRGVSPHFDLKPVERGGSGEGIYHPAGRCCMPDPLLFNFATTPFPVINCPVT